MVGYDLFKENYILNASLFYQLQQDKVTKKKMYAENPQIDTKTPMQPLQQLELSFSAYFFTQETPTTVDSFLRVYLVQTNGKLTLLLKTGIYEDMQNPIYKETVVVDYHFSKIQTLKIEVWQSDDPPVLNQTEMTLGDVLSQSAKGGAKKKLFNEKEMEEQKTRYILVQCTKFQSQKQKKSQLIHFKIEAKGFQNNVNCLGGSCDTFYQIYRQKQPWVLIYESKPVFGNQNPHYKACNISESRLCNNDPNHQFEVRFHHLLSYGERPQIGNIVVTLNQLNRSTKNGSEFPVKDHNKQVKGYVKFKNITKTDRIKTLTDRIQQGLQFQLMIAIDFTKSNGKQNMKDSLHYFTDIIKSPYERALELVSTIVMQFDSDKKVPVYGFGAWAKMPNYKSNEVDHCFPLNGDPKNPEVDEVSGIIQSYREAMQDLTFCGPTYFSEIIKEAISHCRKLQKNQYIILEILTDGDIIDMQSVKDLLIQCGRLPISIIIIGIGKGPFQKMIELDDDREQMKNGKGQRTVRDLVQFVEFEKVMGNSEELARQVLEELPRQVEEYFQLVGDKQ